MYRKSKITKKDEKAVREVTARRRKQYKLSHEAKPGSQNHSTQKTREGVKRSTRAAVKGGV